MIPVTTFAGQTVAIFGLGASGIATARALRAGGANVAAWDDGQSAREVAEIDGIPVVDLAKADWRRFAALVLAPGVPLTHPQPHWTVEKAIAAGIEIIGDIELFCRERRVQAPGCTFIAITGTNGKSTTTALTAHILKQAGRDVQMGGNIGVPVLALEPFVPDRIYVLEMSSFQIDLTPTLDPTIGVLLNITPDHIDRHGTVENYAAIKERLVMAANEAVIGVDDGIGTSDSFCEKIFHVLENTPGRIVSAFSHHKAKATGIVYFDPPFLIRAIPSGTDAAMSEILVDLSGASTLRGAHNAENAAAAFLTCELAGLPHDDIGRAIKTYPGLAHRLEEIGRSGKTIFVNDSKATNADSTEKALLSFPEDIYWIIGGKQKEGGITTLSPLFPRVAKAYLIGAASDAFAKTLDGHVPYERSGTLAAAITSAARDASKSGGTSPVVLLSPACASYDQFKSFEHRGDTFRQLVKALPGFTPRGA